MLMPPLPACAPMRLNRSTLFSGAGQLINTAFNPSLWAVIDLLSSSPTSGQTTAVRARSSSASRSSKGMETASRRSTQMGSSAFVAAASRKNWNSRAPALESSGRPTPQTATFGTARAERRPRSSASAADAEEDDDDEPAMPTPLKEAWPNNSSTRWFSASLRSFSSTVHWLCIFKASASIVAMALSNAASFSALICVELRILLGAGGADGPPSAPPPPPSGCSSPCPPEARTAAMWPRAILPLRRRRCAPTRISTPPAAPTTLPSTPMPPAPPQKTNGARDQAASGATPVSTLGSACASGDGNTPADNTEGGGSDGNNNAAAMGWE
mmetsp:Transcript_10764/g.37686  ORF Transcript_10764/g.37686 Transcript_10764/m.37686 type:complete len:327 (-) Transcript_10764:45-1025(-)